MYRKESEYVDDQDHLDMDNELEVYNEQYSLILQLAKEFLAQAKQSIHKYLQKTKFPVYLNRGVVSKWAMGLEDSLDNPAQFNTRKEMEFSQILTHLKRNIHQMIRFQANFKKEFQQSCRSKKKFDSLASSETTQCSIFQKKSSKLLDEIQSRTSRTEVEVADSTKSLSTKDQDDIRRQLRKIVLPKRVEIQVSSSGVDTGGIMDRIQQKLLQMNVVMQLEKQREETIMGIFQKRRIVVPDVDRTDPAIADLLDQIDQLKTEIEEHKQCIRFLQSRASAMAQESIIVERYTIPKGQQITDNLQSMGSHGLPLSLNFNFAGMNSPRAKFPQEPTGFKKKGTPKQQKS